MEGQITLGSQVHVMNDVVHVGSLFYRSRRAKVKIIICGSKM